MIIGIWKGYHISIYNIESDTRGTVFYICVVYECMHCALVRCMRHTLAIFEIASSSYQPIYFLCSEAIVLLFYSSHKTNAWTRNYSTGNRITFLKFKKKLSFMNSKYHFYVFIFTFSEFYSLFCKLTLK